MGATGSLILVTSIFLFIIFGMSALGEFRANVNNSNYTAQADMGISVSNPLFTVLSYIALGVVAITLLTVFRNL